MSTNSNSHVRATRQAMTTAFFWPMLHSVLMLFAMQIAAAGQPPRILQVFREPLQPHVAVEYNRIEFDTARKCAKLRYPHPFLAVESLTEPKEVWWLNAYRSHPDRSSRLRPRP